MNIITITTTLIIMAETISFNPTQFSQDGDTLYPTGKYTGNGIIQVDEENYCMDAYNIDSDYLIGDANSDGKLSVADLVVLNEFVYNGQMFDAFKNADVNLDSYVSSDDIIHLRDMLISEK